MTDVPITVRVNGDARSIRVEPRWTLAYVLRQSLALTGTHLACEHGACGACTVLVDGSAQRSCLIFGVQVDGSEVTTVEGLAPAPNSLTPLQVAFEECYGLQCGFCTPGFIVSMTAFLRDNPSPSDREIREALSGNLCRCTGYQGIFEAVRRAADEMEGRS